jgi:Flp pilus assembly protein TadD
MSTTKTELNQAALRGVEACKQGKWKEGLAVLGKIAEADRQGAELNGQFYSYLGYGIARYERRVKEGLALCEHSIKVQFYEPENYVNLARVYLLARNRRKAVEALTRALKLNVSHPGARALAREIGWRRPPVIPFLSRNNLLNRLLGKMRYQLQQKE